MRTRSDFWIVVVGTRTSCPSLTSHTLVIFKDMLRARSPTDFLWVHSSRISPMPSRNMTEPAVSKSLLIIETPMAVASRTGTSIFLAASVQIPFQIYFTDFTEVMTARTPAGKNRLFPTRMMTRVISFSQYSLFRARPEFWI